MIINLISKILREVNHLIQIENNMFRFIINRLIVKYTKTEDFQQQNEVLQVKQVPSSSVFLTSILNRKSYYPILYQNIFNKRAQWIFVNHFRHLSINNCQRIVVDFFGKVENLVVN